MHDGTLFFTRGAMRRAGTVQVPKNPTPSKKRGEKRGYTPPPIPDICDKCGSGHPQIFAQLKTASLASIVMLPAAQCYDAGQRARASLVRRF